jgi:hypothetical protein
MSGLRIIVFWTESREVRTLPRMAVEVVKLLFTPLNCAFTAQLQADIVHSASDGASPKANLIATERYCSQVCDL